MCSDTDCVKVGVDGLCSDTESVKVGGDGLCSDTDCVKVGMVYVVIQIVSRWGWFV